MEPKIETRGRPPLPARKRLRHMVNMRLADSDRKALQAMADRNGSTLTEEIRAALADRLASAK